jgi:predicted amidophosphoribosyltransferase
MCPNPECEYDKHTKDANFCILCGTLLYRRCDDCRVTNPKYARFCYYCGTPLDELRAHGEPGGSREP